MVFVEDSENKTLIGESIPEESIQILGTKSIASIKTVDYPSIIIDYSINLHEGVGPEFTVTKNTLINWPMYQNKAPVCSGEFCLGALLLLDY